MHHLCLQAVDSRLATSDEYETAGIDIQQIPTDAAGQHWRLTGHQAATVAALRYGTAPIVINRAMTGDGKTLAGRFLLFNDKHRTLAMYPTNELAHDQAQSFDELLAMWHPPRWGKRLPSKRLINAQEIDAFSFGDEGSATRMERLKGMLTRREYVLTNPDIFHLIMNFAYQQQGVAADLLPTYVAERFPLFVFDEFHLFGVEQTASVMIAILLLERLMRDVEPPRFLFLSATPQTQLTALAGQIGWDYDLIEGEYEHGRLNPSDNHRRILRETDLYLYAGPLEDWVTEHWVSQILPFFQAQAPAAKGLIIANSVATAHRIYHHLTPLCQQADIHLGLNTGITPKADRSRDFDLLVATSTVDVGVDFKINFLVFESRDAASHQQRLGRLGRHEADRNGTAFQAFEAHALLPPWTLDGLIDAFPDGSAVSREVYATKLTKYFAPLQQFEPYIQRWAGIQAAHVLRQLSDKTLRTQYQSVRQDLETDYQSLFGRSVRKYFALHRDGRRATLETASSFRGGSGFTALVKDPSTPSQQVMSYNLLTLLRRAELQAVSIDEMLQQSQQAPALRKTKPLAAYRLLGWRDDYRSIVLELDQKLNEENYNTAIEQNRFRISCVGIPELRILNEALYERTLVSFFIVDKDPDLVRRLLRLGYQLDLLAFRALGNVTGTVAFGRDALLLDSVYRQRRNTDTAFFW